MKSISILLEVGNRGGLVIGSLSILGLLLVYIPLVTGIAGIRGEDAYSFIPLVPLISAYFAFRTLGGGTLPAPSPALSGLLLIGTGVALYGAGFFFRQGDSRIEGIESAFPLLHLEQYRDGCGRARMGDGAAAPVPISLSPLRDLP